VLFGYEIKGKTIKFFVTNNGLPIPEENKKKIFAAFERQKIFNNKIVEGLGIGSSLVKRLSKLLMGTVYFESNETQTTFYSSLPLKEGHLSV
jgi:signal transduction histidine kinase